MSTPGAGQQAPTVTSGDEPQQVFRLIPAGVDADAAPGEATAEGSKTPAQQPASGGKTLPKVMVMPALFGGVLAMVGAVQSGMGWWAAAGGAGLVGTPVAVVAARRIAKRKADKRSGLERALGTGSASRRSGSARTGPGLPRFGGGRSGGPVRSGGPGKLGRALAGRSGGLTGPGGPRSGGLLARLGKGRSARTGAGPLAGSGGPRSGGRLARLLGRGRSGGPAAGGPGRSGSGRSGLLGRGAGGKLGKLGGGKSGKLGGGTSGAGGRSAGRSGKGGSRSGSSGSGPVRPGFFRRATARVRHPWRGWQATAGKTGNAGGKKGNGAQAPGGTAPQGGAGGVTVVPPTRRQRMWRRVRKARPAFNRGLAASVRWAGRTLVQKPILLGARVAGASKRGARSGWRKVRSGPKTAAAAAGRFATAPFRAADRAMRTAGHAVTSDGLNKSLGRAGRFIAGGAGRGARWLGGHGLNRVRATAAKRSTPTWRLIGLDALFGWLSRLGVTAAAAASSAPSAPPVTPTSPIPTPTVSFRKVAAQPSSTAPAPRPAPAVVIPNGGSAMTHHAINQAAEAGAAIGAYDFQNLVQVRNFAHSTPEALSGMAQGFAAAAQRLSETPANAGVAEMYTQIAAGLGGLASAAGEIGMALEAGNADDFNRIDNPRPGEGMADYNTNAAG